ncbi:MAG: hypothetical protein M3Y54_08640 [Bacteroidota bacterium]|nr:hypothetical protein [Bacteroidota bacterium]
MKKPLFLLTLLLVAFTPFKSGAPVDRMGVKGPLTFNQKAFNLAWSDHPKATYFIQEYLPAGETSDRFNQMLTLHLFTNAVTVKDAVRQKVQELETRKQTDVTCHYQVTEGPGGQEFVVDFLLGENISESAAISEFNVYQYKQVDLGGQQKGVLVYTYSERAYGAAVTPFLTALAQRRTGLVNAMIGTEMPFVKLAGK